MRSIHERTVLVTGATSGLGRQLVQRLAGAGAPSSHMAAMLSGSRIYERDPRCDRSVATTPAHA
jgi:FlaA1/EpsC-like NDP-sugar epimerase